VALQKRFRIHLFSGVTLNLFCCPVMFTFLVLLVIGAHSRSLTFFCEVKDADLARFFTPESLTAVKQLEATIR
jgi:hypothetical protein